MYFYFLLFFFVFLITTNTFIYVYSINTGKRSFNNVFDDNGTQVSIKRRKIYVRNKCSPSNRMAKKSIDCFSSVDDNNSNNNNNKSKIKQEIDKECLTMQNKPKQSGMKRNWMIQDK